jgi:hypothetical protein
MTRFILAIASGASIAVSISLALAGSTGAAELEDQLVSQDAATRQADGFDYNDIQLFRAISDSCYKIDGHAGDDKNFAVYFDRPTKTIIKAKLENF